MSLKNKIEKIIQAIKDTDIDQIEISSFWGAQKIKLKKSSERNKVVYKNNTSKVNEEKLSEEKIENKKDVSDLDLVENTSENLSNDIVDDYTIIKAPLVGTYYESSKPGEPPFVELNQTISVGDPVCIIEAMKIFNTIDSEYNGKIMEIFVQDGEPVEFGQELFAIKELDV